MKPVVDEATLATLLKNARSHNGWLPDPVNDAEIESAYEMAKWGPTSMNSLPLRLLLLRSPQAKERLKPALAPPNVLKAMSAPVVAVIAYDREFYKYLPRTFPHNPSAQKYYEGKAALIESTAFRNGTLQAAYFMLALRAQGLDVGPMSGFDLAKVDLEFFPESSWRSNFICGIGHGDPSKIFSRSPRLDFVEIARTL